MVSLTVVSESSVPTQFIVQRNQSLSWYGNKVFIAYIAMLSLGTAGIFAYLGMWLILPFAGLAIFALAIGLYICCLHGQDREVITIDNDKLLIEKGRIKPKQQWQFDRTWLRLELKKSPYNGHPSQLIIRSKGKQFEIAKFLTNKERKSLAKSIVVVLQIPLINR